MVAIETKPYRVPPQEAVSVRMRLIEPDADLEDLADRWEPGMRIRIGVRAELSADFWKSTGIPRTEAVRLVVLVTCLAARARWRESADIVVGSDDHGVGEAELTLDGGVLASEAMLQVMVIGDGRIGGADAVGKVHRGARLWQLERPRVLVLEESEGLFPTSAVSFTATARPRVPWTVELVGGAEPESRVSSSIRLFVNTDLPGCAALVEGRAHSSVYVQMNADVQLRVLSALGSWTDVKDPGLLERTAESDPESLAGFGCEIASRLRVDLERALRLAREEPLELVTRIRECEEYLASEVWE